MQVTQAGIQGLSLLLAVLDTNWRFPVRHRHDMRIPEDCSAPVKNRTKRSFFLRRYLGSKIRPKCVGRPPSRSRTDSNVFRNRPHTPLSAVHSIPYSWPLLLLTHFPRSIYPWKYGKKYSTTLRSRDCTLYPKHPLFLGM